MNQLLKPIRFISNNSADAAILADLLRSYGFVAAEGKDDIYSKADIFLEAKWDTENTAVNICWSEGTIKYLHKEFVFPHIFEETEENRRRRVLRLALHHLITENNISRPNPWGILTGVRPSKMIHRFLDQNMPEEAIRRILQECYCVVPEKIDLLLATVLYQRDYLLTKSEALKKISIYLSFPFCPSRCSYCSFPGYDIKRCRKWVQPCIEAMLQEIRALGAAAEELGLEVQTFYFGGGTPTSMSPADMDVILEAVLSSFNFIDNPEWTVEGGRPETLTEEMLTVLGKYPVNRLCINPQTMQQKTLDHIHRNHSVDLVEKAFFRVRNNENLGRCLINSDLILGLPGENIQDLAETIDRLLQLAPENITLHCLAIKRGSEYKANQPDVLDDVEAAALGNLAHKKLKAAGYVPYYLYRQKDILAKGENVGFTLPGKHSLYNINMMEERQIILGLGVGSSSKFINKDDWTLENMYNPKDVSQYIDRITELIQRKVDKLKQIV